MEAMASCGSTNMDTYLSTQLRVPSLHVCVMCSRIPSPSSTGTSQVPAFLTGFGNGSMTAATVSRLGTRVAEHRCPAASSPCSMGRILSTAHSNGLTVSVLKSEFSGYSEIWV